MVLVIPSIELSEGESVSYIQDDERIENYYSGISRDPMTLAMFWRKENAKCLHIFDNDSTDNNFLNANAVLYIINSVDIPIQYSSCFRSIEDCRLFLNNGVYRIVIDELAVSDPEGVRGLINEFTPSRISFRMLVEKGFVFLPASKRYMKEIDFARKVVELGGNRIVYSSTEWCKDCNSRNLLELAKFGEEMNLKITINNAITNSEQLLQLNNLPSKAIDSCILGEPLYDNQFPCQKIWRMAEVEHKQMMLEK